MRVLRLMATALRSDPGLRVLLAGAVNDNEKVIGLKDFEVNGIQKKVQLLLDSSGAKIKPLKRRTVESTTEAARGIWSGLHDTPFQI